jgi:hypothetical protein
MSRIRAYPCSPVRRHNDRVFVRQEAMVKVVLRNSYALINSEFNDFLYAPIGDEGNGMTLSVISALTRLDIDPWREAARLSALSKEMAAQALAPIIARLPGGLWPAAESRVIATRLVAFLPLHDKAAAPNPIAAGSLGRPNSRTILLMISLAFLLAAMLAMGMHHQAPSSSDSAPADTPKTGTRS